MNTARNIGQKDGVPDRMAAQSWVTPALVRLAWGALAANGNAGTSTDGQTSQSAFQLKPATQFTS